MGDVSARMPFRQGSPARPAATRPSRGRWADAQAFAALDLGTNNCRLLIARPQAGGFAVIDAFSRIVRLGEGLASTGKLSDAAIERTIAALLIAAIRFWRSRHQRRATADRSGSNDNGRDKALDAP